MLIPDPATGHPGADPTTGAPVHTLGPAKGIAAATRIATLDGEIPVEYLAPGDRILTRKGGAVPLRDIEVGGWYALRPCTIHPAALGHDRPQTAITLAPDQTVLVLGWRARAIYGRDEAYVPVRKLVDGTHIVQAAEPQMMRALSLVFDTPQVIYAAGVELRMDVLPVQRLTAR